MCSVNDMLDCINILIYCGAQVITGVVFCTFVYTSVFTDLCLGIPLRNIYMVLFDIWVCIGYLGFRFQGLSVGFSIKISDLLL